MADSSDTSINDKKLTYDWEKIRQKAKVFEIPDADCYPGSLDDETESEFLVPEPPSLSGIIDSTVSINSSSKTTDVEENYVDGDMSSLSNISDIKVSNGPQKHEYGKERMERKGNVYDKLYNASLKGELHTIKDILDDQNITLMSDENGQTTVYAAYIGNHLKVIQMLTEFGYDNNHQDNEGKTPLHTVFENNDPDLAKALITQFKPCTEKGDVKNWTPLHTAIDRGYFSYSQQLSLQSFRQDKGTDLSWIQLHAACSLGNVPNVQILLGAKTDVNHASSAGLTPLHIAITNSNIDLVTLLLEQNVNVNSVTIDHQSPLHIACENGEEAIIQRLLAQKADSTLKNITGNTSLHLAVQPKQEAKTILLKSGTNVSTKDKRLYQSSFQTCSIQTVQAIIDKGAAVNAVNSRGQTPLWFACSDGLEHVIRILLDRGANPNIPVKYSDSSLHAAIYGHCSAETIQKIIDYDAHINAVNKDEATPLLLARSRAHKETVRILLKAKADPNIAYADGDASLHAAVTAYCSEQTIQEIIDHGANVNAANQRGRTALLLACFYRQTELVKVLLEAGADPSLADEEGFSCLYAAVDGNCSKLTLQALINYGAHIDAKRQDGMNALLIACRTGQSESVMFLLEAGADANIIKPDGNTSLHSAVYGNCSKDTLQKVIQHGVSVNSVNRRCQTALLYACEKAQADSVKLLLENGADPNISDVEGYSGLHLAVYGNCTIDTLQDIMTHKAYLNAQNLDEETALWLACAHRKQDLVKALLKAGSNTNIANDKGDTSLHAAVYGNCNKKIISAIIYHGANVNVSSKGNRTALMMACEKSNTGAVNILLTAGADPNIADDDGETCLHGAFRGACNTEVLQTIIDHGADVNATFKNNCTVLMVATTDSNTDHTNVLPKAGADPNIADGHGETCLHHAVRYACNKEVLQAIIDHGADVNATNEKNWTALMIASAMSNIDAINVLLKAGADPNIADAHGDTFLHDTVRTNYKKEVLQAIIDNGADVNATNKNNWTALMIASAMSNIDAINVLLKAGADPNIADAHGDTCLHDAVRTNYKKEVLQAIIDNGADMNATNKNNWTALMIASAMSNIDAINVLQPAGGCLLAMGSMIYKEISRCNNTL